MRALQLVSICLTAVAFGVVPAEAQASITPSVTGPARAASASIGSTTATVDVVGDDGADLYVGTGGLLIPARGWNGPASGRAEAAGCIGCDWKITRLCTKDQLAAGTCRAINVGCPIGTIPVRIWLRRPGGDWGVVGQSCQGPTPPRTVTDVGARVRDVAVSALPPLSAAVQPADGALVGVPALFRTGQPASGIRGADLSVLGLDVVLDARVRWQWSYGDGSTALAARPGGRWPDTSVSHTYRRAGTRTAVVTSVWRGQYTVEGLGPFAVPGPPLTQQDQVTVLVREARAVLVG